ncbi:hypothetical protein [Streptomyces atratus]|uniref:hypothetical protein n=1 Tax=Streptomyces atratus TaxID=1893 RepID=UPI003648001D
MDVRRVDAGADDDGVAGAWGDGAERDVLLAGVAGKQGGDGGCEDRGRGDAVAPAQLREGGGGGWQLALVRGGAA